MRTIVNDKGEFTTMGNSNGVYAFLERNVNEQSRKRFQTKPYYMVAAEKTKTKEV